MMEFAIVLPVILLLMLGVMELGRVLVQYNTLTKALHDGARHAAAYALLGDSGTIAIDSQLASEVRNLVVYGNTAGTGDPLLDGLTTGQVSVAQDGTLQVRVDVAYPYVPALGPTLPNFGLGSSTSMSFTMQASLRMRAL